MKAFLGWLPVLVSCFLSRAALAGHEPNSGIIAHGGWWDLGAEYQTALGPVVGLGVPWPVYTPTLGYGGRDGVVSLDARLGYSLGISESAALRVLALSAWVHEWGDPCGDGCTIHEQKFFHFLSVGVRYEFPCHILVGLDLPLVGLKTTYSREPEESGWHALDGFPPPVSFAFSQACVGYRWGH